MSSSSERSAVGQAQEQKEENAQSTPGTTAKPPRYSRPFLRLIIFPILFMAATTLHNLQHHGSFIIARSNQEIHNAPMNVSNHTLVQSSATDLAWHKRTMSYGNLTTKAGRKALALELKKRPPIFVAGLPKTGTTSVHKYFQGLQLPYTFRSSHTYTRLKSGKLLRAGACMQKRLKQGKRMLTKCGKFRVWSDSGYANYKKECFYPLWHALDEFVEQYPTATIVINTRNTSQWIKSIHAWSNGSLARRWNNCRNNDPPLPKTLKHEEWKAFYESYHDRIRQACQKHSTLNCIEFDIQDPNAGKILEAEFAIPAKHWRNCDPKAQKCVKA